MKKTIDVFNTVVLSLGIFLLATTSNIFGHYWLTSLAYFLVYFLCGLILRAYYPSGWITRSFLVSTLAWIAIIYLITRVFRWETMVNYGIGIVALAGGYYWKGAKILYRRIFGVLIILTLSISYLYISSAARIPIFRRVMPGRSGDFLELNRNINDFTAHSQLKISGDSLIQHPFQAGKVYLLEFYFEHCAPCRRKEPVLTRLAKEIRDPAFQIVYVDYGIIDKYEQFCKEPSGPEHPFRLYDTRGLLARQLAVSGFPHELLIDKRGKIRSVLTGFNPKKEEQYLQQKKELINKILKESF